MASGGNSSHVLTTLQLLLDAFNRHDLDSIMEFFADECILELPRGPDPWGRRYAGKEQTREGLASRFAGIPNVHYGKAHHWACGEEFGISEWTLTGTTTAGTALEVCGSDHYTFHDGKIIRKNSYWKIVE